MKEQLKHIWVITEGAFYTDDYLLCVCRTKGIAENKCRDDGFSYCKKDDTWDGTLFGSSYYRKIEQVDFYT